MSSPTPPGIDPKRWTRLLYVRRIPTPCYRETQRDGRWFACQLRDRHAGPHLWWAAKPDVPCKCPIAADEPHTERQHDRESCHGHIYSDNPPCGGCWDCLCMQANYYEARAAAEPKESR